MLVEKWSKWILNEMLAMLIFRLEDASCSPPHRLHSERETLTLFAPCRPASLGHPLYTLYLETHRKQHQQLRQTRNGNEKARKTSKSGWLVHSFIKLATSTKSERDNSSGIDLFDYLIIYFCAFHYYQGLEQA